MIHDCRPWLPDSTILGERTLALADECLAQWGSKWLAKGRLVSLGGWQPHHGPIGEDDRQLPGGLAITCHGDSRLALASLMLGTPVRTRNLRSRHDLPMIEGLVDDALEDLGATFGATFGARSSGSGAFARLFDSAEIEPSPRRVKLWGTDEDDTEPLLALSLPVDVLVATILRAAPKPRPAPGARPLAEAWAAQEVAVGAVLGTCQVPLAEIDRLEVGDVIVLEQPTGALLYLTVDDRCVTTGAALVEPSGTTQTLVIERPADQW